MTITDTHMLCFFFSFYGGHRDLHVLTHSFPTGRSSDHRDTQHGNDDLGELRGRVHHRCRRLQRYWPLLANSADFCSDLLTAGGPCCSRYATMCSPSSAPDRKSVV